MSEVVGTEMGREVFCLDPKTSWGWLVGMLSERIFMTLADASSEASSLALAGVLEVVGEVGGKEKVVKSQQHSHLCEISMTRQLSTQQGNKQP